MYLFFLERGWALCLFLDVFNFFIYFCLKSLFFFNILFYFFFFFFFFFLGGGGGLGIMPLFRCIYFFWRGGGLYASF